MNAPDSTEPRGRTLVLLRRQHGDRLRVSVEEYNGREYLALRIWTVNERGTFPTSTGITVRAGEIADVIAALQEGQAIVDPPVVQGYRIGTSAEQPTYQPPRKRQFPR
jgi:hypothetical protein